MENRNEPTFIGVLILAMLLQLFWNWLMVSVFGLAVINYWQALGLLFLIDVLRWLIHN